MPEDSSLQYALIHWFLQHQADLPWRRNRDPYYVWLSEIMLQQTQVTIVIPYYERFLARFPTIEILAAAPLDQVLKLWEGLGYYSRARNIHRAAQQIVTEYGGKFPSTVERLRELPGIGRYTAGAIASLAFNVDAPVLDGNVTRVLSRIFNIKQDVAESATQRQLWDLVESLIPPGQAAPWNEGLMELGRRICTPQSPACERCPVNQFCQSFHLGIQEQRPVKRPRMRTPHYDVTAAVIWDDAQHLLIAQRPTDKMLGGLWEFPGGKRHEGETLQECLYREVREELGIEISVGQQIATIKHGYTHFRMTLYTFECRYINGEPVAIECADWAWVTLDELAQYAFPVTDQKIIAILTRGGGQLSMDFDT